MLRSGGEKGIRLSCSGKLGVPLELDWYVGELLELHQGCQLLFQISTGNVGFVSRCCSGKGPHLVMTGEPRGFSGVAAGFSSYNREFREPLVLSQGSPISIRVARGSWGLLWSHCRANRPHLGLCPETPCSSPMVTGISGLHSRFNRGVRPCLDLKQRTPLSSRVVMGICQGPAPADPGNSKVRWCRRSGYERIKDIKTG